MKTKKKSVKKKVVKKKTTKSQRQKNSSKGGFADNPQNIAKPCQITGRPIKGETFKDLLEEEMSMPVLDENRKRVSKKKLLARKLSDKGLAGDVQAFTKIRDTLGEKPNDVLKIDAEINTKPAQFVIEGKVKEINDK